MLNGLVPASIIDEIVAEAAPRIGEAFFADSTQRLPDRSGPVPRRRPCVQPAGPQQQGIIADDQVPPDSPLRTIYADPELRGFLCAVLGIESIHAYDDPLSSINVRRATPASSAGTSTTRRSPRHYSFKPRRPAAASSSTFRRPCFGAESRATRPSTLCSMASTPSRRSRSLRGIWCCSGPGRLHRVHADDWRRPSRLLVVFAFNDEPGVRLSDSAWRPSGRRA